MSYVDGVVVHVLLLRVEDDISVAQGHIVTTTMLRDYVVENQTSKGRLRSPYIIADFINTMEKGQGRGRSGTIVMEVLIVAKISNVAISCLMRDNTIKMVVVILGIMATKTKRDYL